MPVLAQLTAASLLVPLAMTPPVVARVQLFDAAPEVIVVAPTPVATAPAPVVVAPAAVAPVAVAPTTTVVTTAPTTTTAVTTATTTTTTTTTVVPTVVVPALPAVVAAPAPAPAFSPRVAVRDLLRYDPDIAPRYRSGRSMIIGGSFSLGIGGFALLSTLSWAMLSRAEVQQASSGSEHARLADERNRQIPAARIVGTTAGVLVLTGIILIAAGASRRRHAIADARGRVMLQMQGQGLQMRF